MKPLHVAMFPWFAFGHMTPFLHLSNELAQRGYKVSFLLPNKALSQLRQHNLHPDLITFYPISVPHIPGLPTGTETASDIPIALTSLLATAMDMTRPEVETLLIRDLHPDLILYDTAPWIPDIGFKTVCYNVVSAASLAIALVPALKRPQEDGELLQPPPGYPSSKIVLRKHEARALSFIFTEFGSGLTFYNRITTALAKADAIAIRTCRELEGELCDYMESQYGKPMLLTGPILPKITNLALEGEWATFFNRFEPHSVIFCALGSQWVLEIEQFQELVLGFEMTKMPFYIAVKPPIGFTTIDEALPKGFQERVKDRGVVFGGWVPQTQILSHGSVGCFVNHCGFGSMWETLMSDCQIVLVPHLGDQILNSRLLADELKLAVEVEREPNGWFSGENLCKAIKSVMGKDSQIGELLKENHLKMKETLIAQGFMSGYMDRFIQKLHRL
ncbi:anthocyanidin 3-O-glucoside 2'''-O-xylosyltransferase-like [Impatiens glandulifera]|uniref:anthocyanidin 3-O-glucoside 2'''-O-xylosyltransferase-like n=1 Tax=Impatiens glandulifera TaxID=253017 RepID=UPI001FB08A07|nr:anthocyanidin 3-O-glucoside 2'''-O-xylosyltransferase-like [Impatiens glandulifera]